jgi:hypothetical protein
VRVVDVDCCEISRMTVLGTGDLRRRLLQGIVTKEVGLVIIV